MKWSEAKELWPEFEKSRISFFYDILPIIVLVLILVLICIHLLTNRYKQRHFVDVYYHQGINDALHHQDYEKKKGKINSSS